MYRFIIIPTLSPASPRSPSTPGPPGPPCIKRKTQKSRIIRL